MNLFTHIIIVSITLGVLASISKIGLRTVIYFFIAFGGSFLGLFLSFGDSPILMQFPILFNEKLTSAVVSIVFVLISMLIERKHLKK